MKHTVPFKMMPYLRKIASLFFLLSVVSSEDFCTEKKCACSTSEGSYQVSCPSMDITELPTIADLPKKTRLLDLSQNKIETLRDLEEIDGLKILKLNNNRIQNISTTAFTNYNYLEFLDLSYNQLHTLESLDGLSGLRYLNLSHNLLRNLPETLLFDKGDLIELRLAGNPLKFIRYESFRQVSKVSVLDLSETGLTSLFDGVFHDMISLEELDLSSNRFEEVPLGGLQSAQKLKYLYLNKNDIKHLKANSFKMLKNLEVLELSDMGSLENIRAGAFSGLKLLRVLKISNNPNLVMLDFGAFEGLYNYEDVWSLQELNLRQNNLASIESPSSSLCKIQKLDIQGNPWECDCHMQWYTLCELSAELTADLKCAGPLENREKKLIELAVEDMVCRSDQMLEHQQKVLRVVVITCGLVGILFCAIIIVVVVKKRKIMEWWYYRKRGSGAVYYVKANPKESPGEL